MSLHSTLSVPSGRVNTKELFYMPLPTIVENRLLHIAETSMPLLLRNHKNLISSQKENYEYNLLSNAMDKPDHASSSWSDHNLFATDDSSHANEASSLSWTKASSGRQAKCAYKLCSQTMQTDQSPSDQPSSSTFVSYDPVATFDPPGSGADSASTLPSSDSNVPFSSGTEKIKFSRLLSITKHKTESSEQSEWPGQMKYRSEPLFVASNNGTDDFHPVIKSTSSNLVNSTTANHDASTFGFP